MMRYSVAFLLLWHVAASSLSRFPSEPAVASEEDYDSETVMEARAKHIRSTCWKYEDASRPEHNRVNLKEPASDSENPAVVFNFVEPAFQVCAPKQSAVGSGLWKEWRDQAEVELMGSAKQSAKGLAKRMKIVSVEHPLRRLARAYLKVFKAGKQEEEFNQLRKVYRKAKGEMLTFKDLTRFLTYGAQDFGADSPVITDWKLYGEFAPYYETCPMCHEDLYPSFILKTDSDYLETDVEFLQEVFGLEETEFPLDKAEETVSDTSLKAMYGQLTKAELGDLVDFYSVDLDLFQYDPTMFYEMLKE